MHDKLYNNDDNNNGGGDGDNNNGGGDGDNNDGGDDEPPAPLSLDDWLETMTVPSTVEPCEGHVETELVDGKYRIWAAHSCPNKKMILKLKWAPGTYDEQVTEHTTGDEYTNKKSVNKGKKEQVIYNLTSSNNRMALQLGETEP